MKEVVRRLPRGGTRHQLWSHPEGEWGWTRSRPGGGRPGGVTDLPDEGGAGSTHV